MTNLEAAKAKIADYATNPVLLKAMRWLCAYRAAQEHHEYATVRDTAELFMDGVAAYADLDAEEICQELYVGLDPDDTEEEQQICIEEVDQELEKFCTEARQRHERDLGDDPLGDHHGRNE